MVSQAARVLVAIACLWSIHSAHALSAIDLAASFNLTYTKVISFPSSPVGQNDAANYITQSSWGVKKISNNPQNIQFVKNPFPNSIAPGVAVGNPGGFGTVMAVNYPQGSFSHDTGGVQFNAAFEDGAEPFQSMMVSYEVAFSDGFQFVKGGKLPGLRGGPQSNGCSGGHRPNGEDCFSMRLMWRPLGSGEGGSFHATYLQSVTYLEM
ncbi:hypothetical protein FRC03_007697 [Tulasnella sp. 419]|nr:hypothetical protein FRC03_007697 [Tulasnella sp. 419]